MGLDIYHCKATLVKPKDMNPFSDNYFIEDEFNVFDTYDTLSGYIKQIEIPKTVRTLIFIKKESEIEEVKAFLHRGGDRDFFFEKDLSNIDRTVDQFIRQNHLEGCLRHKWEAPKWIGVHVFDWEVHTGIYYEEAGYQRKGMNEQFSDRFYSDPIYCYTQKEDFEFALSCVDYYWTSDTAEEVDQRKKDFKRDFVDSYETGRSFMLVSY